MREVVFGGCYVNFEPIGGIEVNMRPIADDQTISFLADLDIRQEVVIPFHFYPGRFALADVYVCRSGTINVFKAADIMVFGFDIAVAPNPFAKEMAAGGKSERKSQ